MKQTNSIYKSSGGKKAIMAIYDSVLERWPVPCTTLYVPTRYGDTFVITSGSETSPSMVLLHGAGTNSAMWAGDIDEYARHFRVYAVDLIGEPGKSAPSRPDWNGLAYAQWLEDVFNALGLEDAILVGISQGGWIAIKFATWKPERVVKLILLCPGGVTPDRLSFVLRVVPLSFLGRWGIKRINRLIFGEYSIPEELEGFTTLITTQFKSRLGILPIFSDQELKRLTMPILLLIGAQDPLRDANKIISRMRALLPHLEAVIIPRAAHAILDSRAYIMPFLTLRDGVDVSFNHRVN
jgi:pimeloyl-ACP methyl ester carboxylesterase